MFAALIVAIGVWISICARFVTGAESDAVDVQWNAAVSALDRGRYEQAAAAFSAWREAWPTNPRRVEAAWHLGRALYSLERYGEAAPVLEEAADADTLPDGTRRRALALAANAAYLSAVEPEAQQAAALARRYIATHSTGADVVPMYCLLGNIALDQGRLDDAKRTFESALRDHSESDGLDACRVGLARAQKGLGQTEKAESLLRAVMAKRASPMAAEAHFRLGEMYYELNRFDDARQTLSDFLHAYPQSPDAGQARLLLGWVLYVQGNKIVAASLLGQVEGDPQTELQAGYWRGVALKELHRYEEAEATLRETLTAGETTPLAPAIRLHLADVLLNRRAFGEAKSLFERVLSDTTEDDPLHAKALYGLAAWAATTDDDAALDDYAGRFEQAFPQNPLLVHVRRLWAESLIDRERYADAARVFDALISTAPEGPMTDVERTFYLSDVYNKALCYAGLDRDDEAVELLKWLENNGEMPTKPLLKRAEILLQAERAGEAVAALEPAMGVEWDRPGGATMAPAMQDDGQVDEGSLVLIGPGGETSASAMRWDATGLGRGVELLIRAHLATGRFDRARSVFNAYRNLEDGRTPPPNLIEAVALAASDAGQADWAAELNAMLAATGPEAEQRALLDEAHAHYLAGRWKETTDTLETLLRSEPAREIDTEAALLAADAFERQGKNERALAMYDRIIRKYPDTPQWAEAMYAAARYFDQQKLKNEAIKRYRMLLLSSVDFRDRDAAMYLLAWDLAESGDRTEARRWFERLRDQYVQSDYWSHAVLPLAQWDYLDRRYAEARELVELALNHPADAAIVDRLLYLKARIAMAERDWATARTALAQLIDDFPASELVETARFGIAEAAFHEQDFDAAREGFEDLLTRSSSQTRETAATVRLRLAQLAVDERRPAAWREVRRLANEAREACPDFEYGYEIDYLLGRCSHAVGEYDNARNYYYAVVNSETGRNAPRAAQAYLMIADTYLHQGDIDAAARMFQQVEQNYVYPEFRAEALFRLGKCYRDLREHDEARKALARLLADFPDFHHREEAEALLGALQPSAF